MSGTGRETVMAAARLEAVANLARRATADMTPLQRMDGLRLVNARMETRRRSRMALITLSLLAGSAASVATVMVVRARRADDSRARTMAYAIQGGEIGDGGYIRSFGGDGSLLRFEEGTELRLRNGARGRLRSVDAVGARFAIEEGEAEVRVTPRPGARWLVDAGPFLITVRGTVFTAAWNGATERLDIDMKKGLVSVAGPLADGVMAVRAGQHLSVNVKDHEVVLRQVDTSSQGERAEEAPAEQPPEGQAALTPGAGSSHHRHADGRGAAARLGSATGGRSWAAALAAGDLDTILLEAEHKGWRRSMVEANSEDLAALADAARYRRRDNIAREALLTERRRFPSSTRASDSAFLLGRVEEATPSGEARALRWYDLYLKEAPFGAYSSEALGRKMTATQRVRGGSAARDIAQEYLRRFPDGSYAGAARALRDTP